MGEVTENELVLAKRYRPKWARRDSNPEPRDYESPALTVELRARDGKGQNSTLKTKIQSAANPSRQGLFYSKVAVGATTPERAFFPGFLHQSRDSMPNFMALANEESANATDTS